MSAPSSSSEDSQIEKAVQLAADLASALPAAKAALSAKRSQLAEATSSLEALKLSLEKREAELAKREAALKKREADVAARESQTAAAKSEAEELHQAVERRERALKEAEKGAVDAAMSHASAPPVPTSLSMGGKSASERLEMQVLARATAIALVKHGIQQTKASRLANMPPPPEVN